MKKTLTLMKMIPKHQKVSDIKSRVLIVFAVSI